MERRLREREELFWQMTEIIDGPVMHSDHYTAVAGDLVRVPTLASLGCAVTFL